MLFPPLGKFGQFCLVILALSIVANNCPNIYSVSLSMQVLARFTACVPSLRVDIPRDMLLRHTSPSLGTHISNLFSRTPLLVIVRLPDHCFAYTFALTRFPGILARNLRRCLPHGALHLQKRVPRLYSRALYTTLTPSTWLCCHWRLLLWRIRCSHGACHRCGSSVRSESILAVRLGGTLGSSWLLPSLLSHM